MKEPSPCAAVQENMTCPILLLVPIFKERHQRSESFPNSERLAKFLHFLGKVQNLGGLNLDDFVP